MGKRSQFKRVERDYYPTPLEAAEKLFPHLHPQTRFVEPCAGDGRLIRHLYGAGHKCVGAFDIEPRASFIIKKDAFEPLILPENTLIITNPPWTRDILHPLIDIFRNQAPTWLLIDAPWKYTVQSTPFMKFCSMVVAVGRVKWIEGSKYSGKDDCAWYRFENVPCETRFIGRP